MKLSPKSIILSAQHTLAMFGGTILIPMLMGLPPSLGLFCAGIGTLIYHFFTKGQVPIFIGSSAAYLAGFLAIKESAGMSVALGSFVGASLTYFIIAGIVALVGYKKVTKILPGTVAGSIVIVIGITLVPIALMLAKGNFLLALITAIALVIYSSIGKGVFKLFPVLLAMVTGYVAGIFMGVVDFKPILDAPWFSIPGFVSPTFTFGGIEIMMIIALISLLEHIGELTTNGLVVGKNHFEDPGLHRSLLGNGVSLLIAGLFGGTPTTTYGENTGVIAITKNQDPALIRGAAVIAILLSFLGKFGALISSIPLPVVGGVSFMLFGMITAAGITTLKESDANLMDFKTAVTVFLPIFIGAASLLPDNPLVIPVSSSLTLSGLSLAAVVGIVLNIIFTLFNKKPETPKQPVDLTEQLDNDIYVISREEYLDPNVVEVSQKFTYSKGPSEHE